MVYYGVVSRGCQRCRQRKIKCDEQKPGCLRCQRSGIKCPGYRDLQEILFRNESDRIVRRFNKPKKRRPSRSLAFGALTPTSGDTSTITRFSGYLTSPSDRLCISASLSQSADQLGANFFFANYLPRETVIARNFHTWLKDVYINKSSPALRAIVQSIGIAGVSNISPASEFAMESHKRYRQALGSLKQALDDPVAAISDETLTTVNLLSLYEIVNPQSAVKDIPLSHTEGAMTLLELRGQNQYTYERGGHLIAQTCTRVLPVYLQQKQTVPLALVRAAYSWQSSPLRKEWQRRQYSHPGSLSEISFRLVNLRASVKSGELVDPAAIRLIALQIESDLQAWEAVVPTNWVYAVIEGSSSYKDLGLLSKYHIYPDLRVAEDWNNMRIQRIAVNQILLQISGGLSLLELNSVKETIKQVSMEICTSVSSLRDSARSVSLIMPLYIIAIEKANSMAVRQFATDQLRYLGATKGLRKAGILSETARIRLK